MATKASLSNQVSKTTGVPYAVALLATVVALLLRLALNPFLGDYVPYITLFPAVAFCAWYCEIGPSMLRTFLVLIGARYGFIKLIHLFRIPSTLQAVDILASLLEASAPLALGPAR